MSTTTTGTITEINYSWAGVENYVESIFSYCKGLVRHVLENGQAYANAAVTAAKTNPNVSLVDYSPDQYKNSDVFPINTNFDNLDVSEASISYTPPDVEEDIFGKFKTASFARVLNFSTKELPTFNDTKEEELLDLTLDDVSVKYIENDDVSSYSFDISAFSKTLYGEHPSDYEIPDVKFPTFTFPTFSVSNDIPSVTKFSFPSFSIDQPNWSTEFKQITNITVNNLNSITISDVNTTISGLKFIEASSPNVTTSIDEPDYDLPTVEDISGFDELINLPDINEIDDLNNFDDLVKEFNEELNSNTYEKIFENIKSLNLTWTEGESNYNATTPEFTKFSVVDINDSTVDMFEAAQYETDESKYMYWFSDFKNLLTTHKNLWTEESESKLNFFGKPLKTTSNSVGSLNVIRNWWGSSIPQKINQAWTFESERQTYIERNKYNDINYSFVDEYEHFILQLKNSFVQWWTHKISQLLSIQEQHRAIFNGLEYESLVKYYEVVLPCNNLYYQIKLLPVLTKQLSANFNLLKAEYNLLSTEAKKIKYLYNQALVQLYKAQINNVNVNATKQKYNYETLLLKYKHAKAKVEQNILKEQYNTAVLRLWASQISALVQSAGAEELKIVSVLETIAQKLLEIEKFGLEVQKAQLNSNVTYYNKLYDYYTNEINLDAELLKIYKGTVESKNYENQLTLDNALLAARQANLLLQRAAVQADSIDVQGAISEYQAYDYSISNKAQASLNLIEAKVSNYRDVNQIISSYISFLHQVMGGKISVCKSKYELDHATLQTYNVAAQIEALKAEYYETYVKRMVNYAQTGKANDLRAINRKNQSKILLFEAAYKKLSSLIKQYASRINIVEGYGRIYQALAYNYQQQESIKLEYEYLKRSFEDEVNKLKTQLYRDYYNYLVYKESLEAQKEMAQGTLYNANVDLLTKYNNIKYEMEQSKLRMLQSFYSYQVNAARLSIEYGRNTSIGLLQKQRALAGFYAQIGNAYMSAASVGLSIRGGGSGHWSWTRSYSMNVTADSGYVNTFYTHA